jgi:DNA-binding NarL/FixJ family response regulator
VSWVQGRLGTRVVIAHRGRVYAEGLGQLLEHAGLQVAGAACEYDALVELLARTAPDALVLDGGFDPVAGTLARLEPLRAAAPGAQIVVLAQRVDDRLRLAARESEVDGIVLTSRTGIELAAAIAQVAAGHAVVPSGCLRPAARQAEREEPLAALSPRQREVLELLALGLDNDEIGRRLYISRNTVKFHLRAIYERLGVHNRVSATRLLAGADLRSAA